MDEQNPEDEELGGLNNNTEDLDETDTLDDNIEGDDNLEESDTDATQ